ncbi:acyltransferase domain-containing protein [Streptomyces sp. 4N509B]|uniref:acyltransferase domain-containing protein n=1 Tax=Streptomyces sp. 4N509B TaxID=3457413 RepID=UPI003FD143B5
MERRRTVLLLPGQGAQRERMAAGLFGADAAFAREFTTRMTDVFTALGQQGTRLRQEWLRPSPNPAMDEAAVAQPLLLAFGYALGSAVRGAAGPVDILLGHSVGELAAACLAGVFDPQDLGTVVTARASAVGDTGLKAGRGGMLAVAATPEDVEKVRGDLGPEVAVAAVNAPRQTVLAGPREPLAVAETRLRRAGFAVRALRSGHAFHSPVMEPTAQRHGEALARLRLAEPEAGVTILSTRTAAPLLPEEATDPHFWAGQLSRPVRYWPALLRLLEEQGDRPGLLLLDASPDRSLSTVARRHPAVRKGASRVIPLLAAGRAGGGPADVAAFAEAMDRLALERDRTEPEPGQEHDQDRDEVQS